MKTNPQLLENQLWSTVRCNGFPQAPPLSGWPRNALRSRATGVLYPFRCHSGGQASGGRAIHVSGPFRSACT
eukprot:10789741-Lingulodinium_polyedra.AAC.1